MVDKLTEILANLREHQDTPPGTLFEKVMEQLRAPSETELHPDLRSLQLHEDPPGSAQYESIIKAILTPERRQRHMLAIRLKYFAAAAAFIIVFLLAYRFFQHKNEPQDITVNKQTVHDSSQGTQVQLDSTKYPSPVQHKFLKAEQVNGIMANNKAALLPMRDNDLLSSLMDADYAFFARYYPGSNSRLVLDIDQYSSATVSDNMLRFMKTLYSTNRRNKPTSKAKRAKRTLNKWKKTDARYFDSAQQKTAIDIMDLTEFLMDKKNNK